MYIVLAHANNSFSISSNTDYPEHEIPSGLPGFIKSFTTGWYEESELPFNTSKQIGQRDLESELKRDYLFLKNIPYQKSKINVFVKVRPVGVKKDNYLLAKEKTLAQQFILGIIKQLSSNHLNDVSAMKQVAKSSKILKHEVQVLNKQLHQQSKNYDVAITKFVQAIVKNLSAKFGVEVIQSASFIAALKEYTYPFEDLEETLSEHIQTEINLALAGGDTQILLIASHLKPLTVVNQPVAENTEQIHMGRFTRTFNLLNRYEKAAEEVTHKGGSIIGKNIAAACNPSISVPAITDSLNKHARKIYELFERYPDKWPIIRSEFRSVANIIDKETYRRSQIA